jgi:predicted DNA-binding transcriptional regulator YafY
MPPLLLDDEEAIAVAVGLRTAAGASVTGIEETSVRALVKLEQVLPSHLRRRVQALQRATQTLAYTGGPTVDPQCLTVVAAACRDSERVRFAYTARDRTATKRDVEPHALVNAGRRWYLVAWDRDRSDWRTFRLDRVSNPQSTGVRFHQRTLPAEDAAAYVKQSLATATYRYEARVIIHAPADEVRERRWLGGTVEPIDETSSRLVTSDDNLEWLAMRIAMLGWDYELEGPPEVADRLRAIAERIHRATA